MSSARMDLVSSLCLNFRQSSLFLSFCLYMHFNSILFIEAIKNYAFFHIQFVKNRQFFNNLFCFFNERIFTAWEVGRVPIWTFRIITFIFNGPRLRGLNELCRNGSRLCSLCLKFGQRSRYLCFYLKRLFLSFVLNILYPSFCLSNLNLNSLCIICLCLKDFIFLCLSILVT